MPTLELREVPENKNKAKQKYLFSALLYNIEKKTNKTDGHIEKNNM